MYELNGENYYSQESNREFMSVSQFKDFYGSPGRVGCEFRALSVLEGNWTEEPTTAMKVGSYVDAYFEGTLDSYKANNPDMFKRDGELKADFVKAEQCIARVERDEYFMKFLSGEKQVIFTGTICNVPWKIKIDSYIPDKAIVDLKVMASIRKFEWSESAGVKLDFIRNMGYDIQGAVYQEIVMQNTGKRLPFYIAAVSKEKEPDIEIIQIEQDLLSEALRLVEENVSRISDIKAFNIEPDRCGVCDCCRATKRLVKPIGVYDLMMM